MVAPDDSIEVNALTEETSVADGDTVHINDLSASNASRKMTKANFVSGIIATTKLTATGSKDATTFLRGDDTWAVPPGTGLNNVVEDTTPQLGGTLDAQGNILDNVGTIMSDTANIASTGKVRLARLNSIAWRNQANDGNLTLNPSSSDNLTYAGSTVLVSDGTTNDLTFTGRLKQDKGADVASSSTLTLGGDGNVFDITGTTTINEITPTSWQAGSVVHLQFDGILTVTHNSGGTNDILLGDQSNFTTAAGDVLSLYYNGTDWVEISRSSGVGGGGGGGSDFTDVIPCVLEIPQGTVASPDIHALDTNASAKISGFVMPDGVTDSIINFKCVVPPDLNATPAAAIRVQVMTQASLAASNIRLNVASTAVDDGGDLDVALTQETEENVAMPVTSIEHLDYYTRDLTNDPTAGELLIGQITRHKSDVGDTHSGDVMIVGVQLLIDRTTT